MTPVRRIVVFLFLAALAVAGVLFWPFGKSSGKGGDTGLKEARWHEASSPAVKDRQETIVPYDGEAEAAAATAAEAAAEMAAKELEKDDDVADYVLALGDETLTDEEVRARLRRAILDAGLSAEEREDALGHLHNLSVGRTNEQLLPVAQDPALSADLLDDMMSESLNRDFFYQAELALSVLEKRSEPELIEAARRHLAFLAGADHGMDVAKWRDALAKVSGNWARESQPAE